MQFNQTALDAKMFHLDEIKKHPEILERVLKKNIKSKYEITESRRIWVGGGATSYKIITDQGDFFLKIKHKEVTVESKLEEESCFIADSCIKHERDMLEKARRAGVRVPDIVFYEEESDFQFLATEYISQSFDEAINKCTVEELLNAWIDLENNVRALFEANIVHSDIHEFNIRIHEKQMVLIDFEEARVIQQNCQFEDSLDYSGKNEVSCLGTFPLAEEQDYTVKYNSLDRMKQVFKKCLVPKLVEYLKECNYDSANGICTALDHGKSDLTYQSIHNKYLKVDGQREEKDIRPLLIWKLLKVLHYDTQCTYIDVGSNNGLFGREISTRTDGKVRCIGLEGFHKFNILANALAFLEDCKSVEYYDFICGEDDLNSLKIDNKCFMSICSVWHHIQNKDALIKQIKESRIDYILFELPVQEECYGGHSWSEEINKIMLSLEFEDEVIMGESHDYHRPLILLSKKSMIPELKNKVMSMAKRVLTPSLIDRILRLREHCLYGK